MTQATELLSLLEGCDSLAVVCHDNPDPDCLASALALETIAEDAGVDRVRIVYGGSISHQQNRALVTVLEIDAHHLSAVEIARFDALAFVDHSTPGSNTEVPATVVPEIVIDHHPTDPIETQFVDVRAGYGATATIFVEYLCELDLEITTRLASALLFALHRERLDFVRSPTEREYEAALKLFPRAELSVLDQLYGSAFTPATLDAIGRAITLRHRCGSSLAAGVGRTVETDALPQAADYLLNLEGVDTVLVYGFINDRIRLSARSIDPEVDVGQILTEAYDELGAVGGHHDMAGGHLDVLQFVNDDTSTIEASDIDDDERLQTAVGSVLERRFFEVLADDDREGYIDNS